jgi:hypothetical protein
MNKLISFLAACAFAGEIKSVDRQISIMETDVSLTTSDIKFTFDATDVEFLYTVAADYEGTLVSIQVSDALRGESETLPIK